MLFLVSKQQSNWLQQLHEVDSIKSKIRSISAEVEADEMAIGSLSAIMIRYERLAQERADFYKKDIARIKNEIITSAEAATEQINEVVETAKNIIEQDLNKNAELARQDQAKRDQWLRETAENTVL